MDRSKFFASLRKRDSGVFGTSLSQAQVDGTEAILDSCIRNRVTDPHHVAHVLAHVYRETGGHMLPIKETVYASHKDKNPSDATVKARLEKAWKVGKLSWVTTPYWRDGAFGRGPIQITHWANYEKMGKRLGVPLRQKPELALDPKIGADIAVVGMAEGLFTGNKLSDYTFPQALDARSQDHPRRIVNGKDGSDQLVSGYHRAFYSALQAGGYSAAKPAPQPQERPEPVHVPPKDAPARPEPTVSKSGGINWWAVFAFAAFVAVVIWFIFIRR
jgi:predicted chitinase